MIDTLVLWLGDEAKTVAFAILSGVIGFLAKGVYDLWLARRKDKLERVSQQLELLYGPLYAINQSSALAWKAFRSKARPGRAFFGTEPPPSDEELRAWRRWMRTVFQPLHDEMMSVITKHADLLIEDDLPMPLQLFCAHVAAYKVVFEQWDENNLSEHTSVMNYPTMELALYLEESFRSLKTEQRRLLGLTGMSNRRLQRTPASGRR
jgi:hypothetical protein